MTEHKFNWEDYFDLGVELMDKYNEESYFRTIISRFYYASFGIIRKYLIENNIYKNKKSKQILNSKSYKVHSEVLNILNDENTKKSIPEHKQLYSYLYKLRKIRNISDYENDIEIDAGCVDYYFVKTKFIFEYFKK